MGENSKRRYYFIYRGKNKKDLSDMITFNKGLETITEQTMMTL